MSALKLSSISFQSQKYPSFGLPQAAANIRSPKIVMASTLRTTSSNRGSSSSMFGVHLNAAFYEARRCDEMRKFLRAILCVACCVFGSCLTADVFAAKGCKLVGGVCRITEPGVLCLEAALSVTRGGVLACGCVCCCCCALTASAAACLLRLESETGCAPDWELGCTTELSSLFGGCDFCGPNKRRNGTDPECCVLIGALSAACLVCCCCCVFCGWKLQMGANQAWEICRKTEYLLCLGTAHNAARVCDAMGLRMCARFSAVCSVSEVLLGVAAAAVGVLWDDLSRGHALRLRGRGFMCVCRLLGQSWAHLIFNICIGLALVLVLFVPCRKLFKQSYVFTFGYRL